MSVLAVMFPIACVTPAQPEIPVVELKSDFTPLCPCQGTADGIMCVEWSLQLPAARGSSDLKERESVREAVAVMSRSLPGLQFRVRSHGVSGEPDLETLLEERERHAVNWLIRSGVEESRVSALPPAVHGSSFVDPWVEIIPIGDINVRRATDGTVRLAHHFRRVAAPLSCPRLAGLGP